MTIYQHPYVALRAWVRIGPETTPARGHTPGRSGHSNEKPQVERGISREEGDWGIFMFGHEAQEHDLRADIMCIIGY